LTFGETSNAIAAAETVDLRAHAENSVRWNPDELVGKTAPRDDNGAAVATAAAAAARASQVS